MFRRDGHLSEFGSETVVRKRPSLDFSISGLIYVAMMLFMGFAAVQNHANLLFGVFGLMIGTLLVSSSISSLVLKKLQFTRILPDHGSVGHPLTITYQISNRKKFWPTLSISISELDGVESFTTQPGSYLLHAAAQMTASVPALVVPKRRGLCELNRYQLGTSFPFGFVKRALTGKRREVILIHPPLAQVDRRLLAMCRSAESSGETMRPRPGGADEFYGVREYRPGDNPRWIYWRRSARSGGLVLKEMTRVAPPRILILVDTCMSDRSASQHAAVEKCICMAASLAIAALDQGLSVGLCAWAGHWVTVLPTRGKRHREDLLSILSRLPLNLNHQQSQLVQESERVRRGGTTAVLFTPRDQPDVPISPRGAALIIPADSARANLWFRFGKDLNFAMCVPADQLPHGPRRRSPEFN